MKEKEYVATRALWVCVALLNTLLAFIPNFENEITYRQSQFLRLVAPREYRFVSLIKDYVWVYQPQNNHLPLLSCVKIRVVSHVLFMHSILHSSYLPNKSGTKHQRKKSCPTFILTS